MNDDLPPAPTRQQWWWLAAGLCVLYVGFLGSRGLNEPDEGRYANIAQAMSRPGGDWWEPRMSGYGHYDKPPLVYWVAAAGFRAFGLHEWAARLPSLLGAFLALGGLGWTAYRLRGAVVAWWAVLLCGTSVQFWAFGRILSPDMLLTGWCTVAVAAWAEGRHRLTVRAGRVTDPVSQSGGAWGWWLLSLSAWTLAWWTKATPALIPLAGLTLGACLTGDRPGRRALKPLRLVSAVLLLGSPWYLSMLSTYPELRSFFFGRELAGRLAGRVDGRHGTLLYYLPVSLVAWLPWWPVAVWAGWRAKNQPTVSPNNPLRGWKQRLGAEGWIVLTGLFILSLTASKLSSYTLTLAPWAALLMARATVRLAEAAGVYRPALWIAAGFAAVVLLGVTVLPRRYEARLGVNSSVREVCAFLKAQGATRVDMTGYRPGLEFYLGETTVCYIIRVDGSAGVESPANGGTDGRRTRVTRIERYRERASDPGVPPDRFVEPSSWPQPLPTARKTPVERNWWLVRYRRQPWPRFDQGLVQDAAGRRPVKVKRIGDFDLYQVPDSVPP